MEKKQQETETLWAQIMEDMRTLGQAGGYASDFVSQLRLMEDTGSQLIIEYPSDMPFIWLEMNYSDSIAHSASRVLGGARELYFVESGTAPAPQAEDA